jgi:uncharacterized membrane protein HdeD (DUF308 family)
MKWLHESIKVLIVYLTRNHRVNAKNQTRFMKKFKASRLLVVAAIVFILTGLFCFVNPLKAYVYLVKFSGAVLLLSGVVLQIASSTAHISFISEKRSMRIESILDFVFGFLLLFNPFMTFILYPMLIGYWILCFGLIKIGISLLLRNKIRGWLFILVVGLLAIGFAIGIIYAPSTRANDITLIIGAFFVIMGSALFYDSTKLKRSSCRLI